MDRPRPATVRQVLHGLRYPARKWQIVTQADIYGADLGTRDQFRHLPEREYRDCDDVAAALAGALPWPDPERP